MIGRALDRLIDNFIISAGDVTNRFLDHYWPMKVTDRAAFTAEVLADAEAHVDCYEPDDLWAAEELADNPVYLDLQRRYANSVKRPFEDTDDFAEPVGEHPDIDPQAVIGKRPHWNGIGGAPINPVGAGDPPAPGVDGATSDDLLEASIYLRVFSHRVNDPALQQLADRIETSAYEAGAQ